MKPQEYSSRKGYDYRSVCKESDIQMAYKDGLTHGEKIGICKSIEFAEWFHYIQKNTEVYDGAKEAFKAWKKIKRRKE